MARLTKEQLQRFKEQFNIIILPNGKHYLLRNGSIVNMPAEITEAITDIIETTDLRKIQIPEPNK